MTTNGNPAAETESLPRPLDNIPEAERAKEIDPADPESDMHGDPDDPTVLPPASEAAAVRAWRVAKSLLQLRAQINALAPDRATLGDGTIGDASHQSRASDHNPWVKDGVIGIVTAMDITHSPDKGCDAERLAAAICANKDSRVKYIIWNRRIANASAVGGVAAWAWRPYNGRNPHNHHIHISVKPEKASYDAVAAWTLPAGLGPSIPPSV